MSAIKFHTHTKQEAFYEIMWKNIVEPGRPQMTVWRMHIAWWKPKATITHSEYCCKRRVSVLFYISWVPRLQSFGTGVNLPLPLLHDMEAIERAEVLNHGVNRGERWTTHPGRFKPRKELRYPPPKKEAVWAPEPVWMFWSREKNFATAGIRFRDCPVSSPVDISC